MSIFDKLFGNKDEEKSTPSTPVSKPAVSSTKPDMTDNPEVNNIVELKGIDQSYGDVNIIKDFNLLVEEKPGRGNFVVILGPSGCGKSTILRHIAGLQEPSGGNILINGKPRTKEDHVGMVFQKYSSFPWRSVHKNVYYGLEVQNTWTDWVINQLRPLFKKEKKEYVSRKEMKARAMEMIKTVGLEGHERKYAQYPTLSGGQLQRVAIARSLLSTPDILLMDEPFGALDIGTRHQMQDMLVDLWEKLHPTIFLVTHDIQEAVYLADDIYIMSHAPSNIVHHVRVSDHLPDQRKGIKRDPKFTKLVHQVEDLMIEVDKNKPKS
jgi:NitT/TauT family transport system ATP-binding protein